MNNPECQPPEVPVFPLPIKTATDCGPGPRKKHPAYERAYTLQNSKRLMLPLAARVMTYLEGKIGPSVRDMAGFAVGTPIGHHDPSALMGKLKGELEAIVAIEPPDELLADYRALRLRLFFENFLRTAINSVVDPTGAVSASRLLTADGRFGDAKFTDLSRFGIAALIDGRDEMIRDACHLFLDVM